MWSKFLYLELRAIGRRGTLSRELVFRCRTLGGMAFPKRAVRPQARQATQIRLMLRTPDGSGWGLILSKGMEHFIGHYPRVAGLGSGGPLLRYELVRS